jgi:hypothetical protein
VVKQTSAQSKELAAELAICPKKMVAVLPNGEEIGFKVA